MKSVPREGSDVAKVSFRLFSDQDGFPPADWEHLWADGIRPEEFRLGNIPFFAYGVSCGDIVRTARQGEINVFQEVVRPSGHGTIRVILTNPDDVADFVSHASRLGCDSEQSHIPGYIAVDVPPSAQTALIRYLDEGEAEGNWEYEISAPAS